MTERILLSHGGGGEKTQRLISDLFLRFFPDPLLRELTDGARIGSQVFTTDSFVVSPLVFPGGDIGRLAVCGTANDLAVMGAKPAYLSLAFILEEGLEISLLERIVRSIRDTAAECGIRIVTGDTKVVEKGKADGMYISASGIGGLEFSPAPSFSRIRPGDLIVLSGRIGDHAASIVTSRGEFGFQAEIVSDVAPVWPLVRSCSPDQVKFMRDPTRGGVAQILHEIVHAVDCDCRIDQDKIPVSPTVRSFCNLLGYDPLYLANEGKVLLIADPQTADSVLQAVKAHPQGSEAAIIGEVTPRQGAKGRVTVRTELGAQRILMPPVGELVPRIC